MAIPNPFSTFTLSHQERIERAAQDLLVGDEAFANWCGRRVHRLASPLRIPETETPAILIASENQNIVPELGRETDVVTRVAWKMVFTDQRSTIDPGVDEDIAASPESLIKALLLIFFNGLDSQDLKVERYANQKLIDRIQGLGIIDYVGVTQAEPAFDTEVPGIQPENITSYLTFGIDYVWKANKETWEYVGFTP